MKASLLLLSASLLANVAFVAVAITRTSSAPSAPATLPPEKPSAAVSPAGTSDALRAALNSGDAAALEAAGVSRELAREITLGRTVSRLADKVRAASAESAGEVRWWRNRSSTAARDAQLAARRELAAALGFDLSPSGDSAQFAFLPAAKREALRRITDDYDEMLAKFGASGLQLPSDREKLRLLRAERERDIAALLSPEEKLAYDLRTSPSAASIRSRYGEAIDSEAEFQKIYALQKAFDEKFPREALTGRISPDTLRARSEAERQLDTDLRAAVGDERYAALRRAADSDVRNLDGLVSRLNLPAAATDTVIAARDTYAAESQRINGDTSIPFPQRRAQIQALADRAKGDVTRTLGAEAGATYAQASPWINHLANGMAYSTQPQANSIGAVGLGGQQSVYPVMPGGVSTNGSTRQVIINGTPSFDGATVLERPAGAIQTQVMTISTTDHTTTTTGGTATPATITPAQPAAPKP